MCHRAHWPSSTPSAARSTVLGCCTLPSPAASAYRLSGGSPTSGLFSSTVPQDTLRTNVILYHFPHSVLRFKTLSFRTFYLFFCLTHFQVAYTRINSLLFLCVTPAFFHLHERIIWSKQNHCYCRIHFLAYTRSNDIIFKLSSNYTSEQWWTYFLFWNTKVFT